jgi:putative DNA primase/helicase
VKGVDPSWQGECDTIRGHIFVALDAGLHVFPVDHPQVPYCDGIKTKAHDPRTCDERGKHPAGKWKTMATTDVAVLGQTNYFGGGRPHNIGVACGPSGLVVLDEDQANGMDRACEAYGETLPETYTVETAKGRHFYFAQPHDETLGNQAGGLKAYGIDVRGDGGYVVGAGSLHALGVRYTLAVDVSPAPLPEWVIRAIKVRTLRVETAPSSTPKTHDQWWSEGEIPDGRRHDALVAVAGWARRHGLTIDEARPFVLDVQSRCAGDEHTPEAALATLADVFSRYPSGYRDGAPVGDRPAPAPKVIAVPRDKPRGPFPDGKGETDVDHAARVVYAGAGRLRFVHGWGKWMVYDGGRWVRDEGDVLVTEKAKAVARMLFGMAQEADDPDMRKRLNAAARKAEKAGAIGAMVKLARGVPGILVDHEELDANPYILNCANGTVDLRTGKLRRHDPADLCTMQIAVAYDPKAEAPLWAQCVDRWQPDPAVRQYVQVRAGAGTTGVPTETVDVDYGSGGNGKSKFWGAIQYVLAEYAVIPHKSLLMTTRHPEHATVVANLFRRRLAIASETSSADVLNDEQVKQLTGGDRLSGRRMREDEWEFDPTHTLVMFSNHKPQVQGRDEGVWRRLRLVPWQVTIPEDERDPNLAEKLRAEAPGILAWLVEGARTFLADGLTPPDAVRVATAAYRQSEDTIGRFIADELEIGDGKVLSGELMHTLTKWAEEQGIDPAPRMNELAEALRNLGAMDKGRRKIEGKRGTLWEGVKVRTLQESLGIDQGEAF